MRKSFLSNTEFMELVVLLFWCAYYNAYTYVPPKFIMRCRSVLINAPMNNEKSSALWLLCATACALPEILIINVLCPVSIPVLIFRLFYVKHIIVHKWSAFELFAMPNESICDIAVFYFEQQHITHVCECKCIVYI